MFPPKSILMYVIFMQQFNFFYHVLQLLVWHSRLCHPSEKPVLNGHLHKLYLTIAELVMSQYWISSVRMVLELYLIAAVLVQRKLLSTGYSRIMLCCIVLFLLHERLVFHNITIQNCRLFLPLFIGANIHSTFKCRLLCITRIIVDLH